MMKPTIVITGMGAVTPIGSSVDEFWESNIAGTSGLRLEERMDLSDLPCGWVAGTIPEHARAMIKAKSSRPYRSWSDCLMHAALDQALDDAKYIGDLHRPAALVYARVWPGPTGSDPADYVRHTKELAKRYADSEQKPGAYLESFQHAAAQQSTLESIDQSYFPRDVSQRLGYPIMATRVEATCSGGLRAIIEATRMLESGEVDFAIVAACVSRHTHYVLSQYAQLMALSRWKGDARQASMPFDKRRCGMVLSESVGALVLETEDHAQRRGVDTYHGLVTGWGLALDTSHVTAPRVDAIERVIQTALTSARLSPEEIDVVNAHGTSTRLNDVTEARALHKVFGKHMEQIKVCAVKSLTGHGSAASGIIESIVAARTLCRGVVPPVVTCTEPDPECAVNTSLTPVFQPVQHVLKDSFGFGGQYASVVFTKPNNPR